VLTWAVPLAWWATLLFAALFCAIGALAMNEYRLRIDRAIPAIVTSLLAIALFGISYAIIGLAAGGEALGVDRSPQLGEAFLIATSLGIAGGLLDNDDLALGTKLLAHIQLLLFLTALVAAVATVIRTRRAPVPSSGPAPASDGTS
jgi:hypothetical protein